MAGNLDNLSGTRFLATQTFPIGQSYAGWQIDGLSGLDYDAARNTFIAVRDNAYTGGPNGPNTPPYFSLTPIFSAGTPGYTLQFSGVTPLDTAAWMPGMRGLDRFATIPTATVSGSRPRSRTRSTMCARMAWPVSN